MKNRNKKIYEMRANILKAMAHPSRLLMIDALNEHGEMCVCDLVDLVGADQSTVSKHLALLKQAGLVDDRKEGTKSFYRLARPCVLNFFECVEQVMEENLKAQQEALSAR
ncbi:MAG: transcriptional regulator [Candidatus Abyssobacteria bacterium SURF_5]|uniref:Transcriptional regulator n=1 Tax=Abyssobacteria bacterium (strain SURF_5) TaxID=2093360 RepID=A0A3A4NGH2_ABYX5|nr:MAG: transcriptional regulator [Candidatus Abyssubacteria bacterium SURF_5]